MEERERFICAVSGILALESILPLESPTAMLRVTIFELEIKV